MPSSRDTASSYSGEELPDSDIILTTSDADTDHFRLLEGHEYGGQSVCILDSSLVFSASLDRSVLLRIVKFD